MNGWDAVALTVVGAFVIYCALMAILVVLVGIETWIDRVTNNHEMEAK